jgi:hypothetical protein
MGEGLTGESSAENVKGGNIFTLQRLNVLLRLETIIILVDFAAFCINITCENTGSSETFKSNVEATDTTEEIDELEAG